MIYILLIVGIFALDRVVKYIVATNMNVGESFAVIGDFFRITYVQNRGAAFSLMEGKIGFLTGFPLILVVVGIILMIAFRKKFEPLLQVSIAMICAGGLGNLVDRIFQGYVVDMFDFGTFPVFNVADIAVCVGCGLMILHVFLSERKDKK